MTTLRYERQACRLCGGSGRDPYTHGAGCRKCGGRKVELSAAGKRAQKKLEVWLDENASVRLDELKAGDEVVHGGVDRVVASVERTDLVRQHAVDADKTYVVVRYDVAFEDGDAGSWEQHPSLAAIKLRVVADAQTVDAFYAVVAKTKGVEAA